MSKTIPVTDQRETPEQFLTRNLRVAVKHLPEWDSKHMNYLEYRGLPIPINGVYGWQNFLIFVHSWQPITDDSPDSGNNCLGWSTGLNLDQRDEKDVLAEMEKVLFLCHYLSALVKISKISAKWSHLDEGIEKDKYLKESKKLEGILETLDKPYQLKEIQALGEKLRRLFQAMG